MVPRPKHPPKTICSENQHLWNRLAERRYQLGDGCSYQWTLKRAMDSLAKCKVPITTYKEALALPHVGTHCATILFPPSAGRMTDSGSSDPMASTTNLLIQTTTIPTTTTITTKAPPLSETTSTKTRKRKTTVSEKDFVSDTDKENTFHSSNVDVRRCASTVFQPVNRHDCTTFPDTTLVHSTKYPLHQMEQHIDKQSEEVITLLHSTKSATTAAMDDTIAVDDFKPTPKEEAYISALNEALEQNFIGCGLHWNVLLIIDGRERKSQHIQAKCEMSGVPCEERYLPIGDMAWIAQGYHPSPKACQTKTGKKEKPLYTKTGHLVVVEVMLGTIIERKTTEDLKCSLFGTRYYEQRLRLQNSGLPQVLFLVEGDMNKELFRCSADTLNTAVWETRLSLGFTIVHTAHMDETVITLKRMHRRILQRTFPKAFYDEALPTFQELYHSNDRRTSFTTASDHQDSNDITSTDMPHRRRRRRRVQSLMEMTFDTDPAPPLGTSRFITYKELKTKVERDREAGTKTIGSIHQAMMKQVATFSVGKCQAVARRYPTMNALMTAYYRNVKNKCADVNYAMVSSLPIRDPEATSLSTIQNTIGPRSSSELYVVYGTIDRTASSHRAQDRTEDIHDTFIRTCASLDSSNIQGNHNSLNVTEAATVAEACVANPAPVVITVMEAVMEADATLDPGTATASDLPFLHDTNFSYLIDQSLHYDSPSDGNADYQNDMSNRQSADTYTTEGTNLVLHNNRSTISTEPNLVLDRVFHGDKKVLVAQRCSTPSPQHNLPELLDLTASPEEDCSVSSTFNVIGELESADHTSKLCPLQRSPCLSVQSTSKRASDGSKKSARSSTSTGIYSTSDDITLDRLVQDQVFSQTSESESPAVGTLVNRRPISSQTSFFGRKTGVSSHNKNKISLKPKPVPSSLLKSLKDTLNSSDDEEETKSCSKKLCYEKPKPYDQIRHNTLTVSKENVDNNPYHSSWTTTTKAMTSSRKKTNPKQSHMESPEIIEII